MVNKSIYTAIVCFIVASSYGQEAEDKNMLSVAAGLSYVARQDLVFSPLIHTDYSFLNFSLYYTRQAEWFQKGGIRYGNFNPMVIKPYDYFDHGEPETAYPHSFNLIDIDYHFGKNVASSTKSILTTGGLFLMDIQALNYTYGRIGSFGYYSAIGLGVFGTYELIINEKSDVTTTLNIPLVSWFSRSPYLVNDDEFIENISSHSGFKTFLAFLEDGKPITLNKLQTLDLEIQYGYALNGRWELAAAYLFEFIHSNKPRNLNSYRHSFVLNVNLYF